MHSDERGDLRRCEGARDGSEHPNDEISDEPGALGRWSLPLIGEIGGGWRRFSALQRGLAPISPRALSLELASLCDAALVDRRAPGPLYGLTGLVSLLAGGTAFLDYTGLENLPGMPDGAAARAWGTLTIETGVTMAVMGVMITLYDDLVAPARGEA